jgi:DHA1 family inner membrane transport protein
MTTPATQTSNEPAVSFIGQALIFAAIRLVINTAHRMVYPFLAVFRRGLGVSLATFSLAMTARGVVGAFGPFLAVIADSRGRRTGMLTGLGIFLAGTALVIFWPTFPVFLLALALTMLGKYVFDPSMQAYIGDRVPYQARGRVIAVTEFGWSFSFIIGIPAMGFLIASQGWMGPYPLLLLLGTLSFLSLIWLLPGDGKPSGQRRSLLKNLGAVLTYPPAIAGLALSLLTSSGNEIINLVFGIWLEDAFGLQIAALGAASAVIGFSELTGEGVSAMVTDRLGKPRAIGIGIIANSCAALMLPLLGTTLAGAVVALFFFYLTFEFTLVSAIPMMTEIMPTARATVMAANISSLSIGRGLGAALAAQLYVHGLLVNGLMVIILNMLALFALYQLRKRMSQDEQFV